MSLCFTISSRFKVFQLLGIYVFFSAISKEEDNKRTEVNQEEYVLVMLFDILDKVAMVAQHVIQC